MLPLSDVYRDARVSVDPGSSPYWWTNTPSMSMAAAWGDGAAGTNPAPCNLTDNIGTTPGQCNWVYFWPEKDAASTALASVKFEAPPTLVLFQRVTFHWWADYTQSGPNNWITMPRFRAAIRNRAGTGYLYGPTTWEMGFDGSSGSPVTGQHNCKGLQTNCGANYEGPVHCFEDFFSHPEGGPFTTDDMVNLVGGIYFDVPGPGYDNSQGSFFKARVFHLYLEVEVITLGGFVRNVRHATSLDARLLRRARNVAAITVPDLYADRDLFSKFYASHPRGPAIGTEGWGERRLERRSLQLLERTYWPEQLKVIEGGFDLRDYECLAWGVFRIDGAWTPELNGLCYLDQGGDFAVDRAQDAWSSRPGDGVLMRVLEDYANLSREGLACQGGGDVAISLRNYDMGEVSWSQVSFTGDTATASDGSLYMVDELGYQSSQVLTFGAVGGTGGFSQSLGTVPASGGNLLHVRAGARVLSNPSPLTRFLEYALIRTGTRAAVPFTEYWDEVAQSWSAVATYNQIPATAAYGEIVMDCIPCDDPLADAAPSYSHRIGRFSSAIQNCEFIVGVTDVQKGGAPNGSSYGARTQMVVLDAPITRIDQHFEIDNSDPATRSLFVDRGVIVAEFRPFFRSSELPDGTVKPILTARHTGTDIDRLEFARVSGANRLRFRREWGVGTRTVEVPIPDIDRSQVVRVWCRWLGSEGWQEFAPYSMQVGFARYLYAANPADESFVDEGRASARNQTTTLGSTDWIRVGSDDTPAFLDGWMRSVEIRRNPLHEVEAVWRR